MANSEADTVKTSLARREIAERNRGVLERRISFESRHPEIDIRAKRENGGPLAFYVTEEESLVCWLDGLAMMTELEQRYDNLSQAQKSNPDE